MLLCGWVSVIENKSTIIFFLKNTRCNCVIRKINRIILALSDKNPLKVSEEKWLLNKNNIHG